MEAATEAAHGGTAEPPWAAWVREGHERAPGGWLELVGELAELQDHVAAAIPSDAAVARVRGLLAQARAELAPYEVAVDEQLFGRLVGIPGRGQTMVAPVQYEPTVRVDGVPMELHGTTEFGRFHAGFGGAVHGGAIASVLDEALGSLANRACGSVARTAFLNVTFRAVTPTDRPLDISARITSIDGRKLHVSGELCDGTTVCARAEGLFVRILSGPPIPPSA